MSDDVSPKTIEAIKSTTELGTWILEPDESTGDLNAVGKLIIDDIASRDPYDTAAGFAAVFGELLHRLSKATGQTRHELWSDIAIQLGERCA
ncbi:hypothetical protein B0293_07730 [Amycolatopsis azurea DSM 43854]|uniref:Uncharacterized protein n=1 Tax=Amycolatopsis azurea DSM 43854 TaxID=1238180 RepID=M2QSY2_9PSEU|nr:hypothetical protein C791_2990 [Amycolatopsis azurea DSM 43854]OOC07549.1 hypothetical protein B0293_07730 [Amycolatopsis azurea DSM 43854]